MQIKINLTKIKGAFLHDLKGKSGTVKKCLIIPIESSGLISENGSIYVKMFAFELKEKKSQSHFIKQIFNVDELDHLTEDEKKVVIGGIKAENK